MAFLSGVCAASSLEHVPMTMKVVHSNTGIPGQYGSPQCDRAGFPTAE